MKREYNEGQREREREIETGAPKAKKGGLYKKTTNSYSPSKVAKKWRSIPFDHVINNSRQINQTLINEKQFCQEI